MGKINEQRAYEAISTLIPPGNEWQEIQQHLVSVNDIFVMTKELDLGLTSEVTERTKGNPLPFLAIGVAILATLGVVIYIKAPKKPKKTTKVKGRKNVSRNNR